MIFHKNISPLIDNYEYFVLDLWGVIHDGTKTYPGVIERLTELKNAGKKVCFLSNAPRRSAKVAALLEKLGVGRDLYDFILTSGEAAHRHIFELKHSGFYYYIGPEKDADLLDGLAGRPTDAAAKADFAIITGFDDGNYEISSKMPQLVDAHKNNLELICANPDLTVVKQSGEELLCAGILAREYQKMGGKVTYFGKPYDLVYNQVFNLFSIDNKAKILAVGDGIETDILGANHAGIDSALIAGGIFANELKIKHGELPDADLIKKICDKYKANPTFIIGSL